jgi:apolipoprotein N-acyltransferase
MAVMRGVESGFSLTRAAKQGYLTVSDNRGRILAETRSDAAPFVTLIADVPAVHDTTVFVLLGDWFAWLALAILVFTLVQFYRLRHTRMPERVQPFTAIMSLRRTWAVSAYVDF